MRSQLQSTHGMPCDKSDNLRTFSLISLMTSSISIILTFGAGTIYHIPIFFSFSLLSLALIFKSLSLNLVTGQAAKGMKLNFKGQVGFKA